MSTSNKVIKGTEHCDSQHGWVAIKRKIVDKVMGLKNVSYFSYQRGETVYLEGDRDFSIFVEKAKQKGYTIETKAGKHYESSPIRHYESFELREDEKDANITDHQFASYLRDNNAIDNFESIGRETFWYDEEGKMVAKAIYDNSNATREIVRIA